MGRFKGGLRCKGKVNSVITNLITYSNLITAVFLKCKYNVKTCMYTMNPLYQIINFNVSST